MSEEMSELCAQFHDQSNKAWFEGKLSEALKLSAKAVESLPEHASPQVQLNVKGNYALCLAENEDFAKALALYPTLHTLCIENGLNATTLVRQWAKALEQSGDFRRAREIYQMVVPDENASRDHRLKWNHAMGLLNWRDGRLVEAHDNLAIASSLMPDDPKDASTTLAVYGNDALLSLELGFTARAYRLVDKMIDIRAALGGIPLSSELNLIKVRAAIAAHNRDFERQAAIYQDGINSLAENAADSWQHRISLADDYVTATLKNKTTVEAAIRYLSRVRDDMPPGARLYVQFPLAKLYILAGQIEPAEQNLTDVIAHFVGNGSAESEVEIIIALAGLANLKRNKWASVLLSKIALKYIAQIAGDFQPTVVRTIVDAVEVVTCQASADLRALGRFEEAAALESLLNRIMRRALFTRAQADSWQIYDPVPLNKNEREAETHWFTQRRQLAATRDAGNFDGALQIAGLACTQLLEFRDATTSSQTPAIIETPGKGVLRISLVPSDDTCSLICRWPTGSKTVEISRTPDELNELVARLNLSVFDDSAWRAPASELYALLIKPIEEELHAASILDIDASGVLGRIPFCLLSDGNQCLIQKVLIKYVLSAPAADVKKLQRTGLLHCAAFKTGPLAEKLQLPEATQARVGQLRQIAGSEFTRTNLINELNKHPAYLSIATHLDSEPTRPEQWALSTGGTEPIYLTDFAGPDFGLAGVDIALLATCSSGLFDATDRERQSFAAITLDKGVKSVVGTLWEISETAAAEFTRNFWSVLANCKDCDPVLATAELQRRYAKAIHEVAPTVTAAGGIGDRFQSRAPAGWASFCVFQNSNAPQRAWKTEGCDFATQN